MKDNKLSLYKVIGQKIKSKREDLKISQLELSENLDISRASISNIEVGRHQIPLHVLYEVSKVLKLDVQELLPSYNEILQFAASDISDYSTFLKNEKFNKKEINSIGEVIKNI